MRDFVPRYEGTAGEGAKYGKGYVGFSFRPNSITSQGIVWFSAQEYDQIKVSHAFIVESKDSIIEATGEGVHRTPISHYFDDPDVLVFFKKPINLDADRANRMVSHVASFIGAEYDFSLLFYFINRLPILKTVEQWLPFKKCPSILDSPDEFICSELVCAGLKQISEYSNLLPLSDYHISKIDPQLLFRGNIFKPWKL